jgi:hypothetical protein
MGRRKDPTSRKEEFMKRLAIIFAVSATVLICGCGGTPGTEITSAPAHATTPAPTTQIPNLTGNWQFIATSTGAALPLTIAGGINQAGVAVNGALHVDRSNCIDRLTIMSLTGNVTAGDTSLTATSMNGQAVTFTGNFTNTTFTGTYKIKGGCATGEQGNITGINVPYIANQLSGTFTTSTQETFNVTGDIAQSGSANSEGSFEITGTANFDSPCFGAATIRPGTFPSDSFILGTSVGLEFETGNGILTFLGTLNQDGSVISGSYTVSGSTCNQNGIADLRLSSPWDY